MTDMATNIKNQILLWPVMAAILFYPAAALALQMPSSASELANMMDISSRAYVVADANDGRIILAKDADIPWVAASLTKLITALVFLDTQPNMSKVVKITAQDQQGGACSSGGACIATKPGVSYPLKDLFNASIVASANNATMALARSTGLSAEQFVNKMNEKARQLGAIHSNFVEPTGMSASNIITASDYAKIVKVALDNPVIAKAAAQTTYNFTAVNNRKFNHKLKSTNKLLGDLDAGIIGGKTGYLAESQYNFASRARNQLGGTFLVVVLGSKSNFSQFKETKELAALGSLASTFSNFYNNAVLGTSTEAAAAK